MLLQNNSPQFSDNSESNFSQSVEQAHTVEKKASINSLDVNNSKVKVSQLAKEQFKCIPWWLRTLLVMKSVSSIFCYLSVGSALLIYGMTVYAPELWTQKYEYLKDLQKKERQFTSNDETIKNKLANIANEPSSGLVDPDPTKPAIFLPITEAKSIQPVSKQNTGVKTIDRVYPIAY